MLSDFLAARCARDHLSIIPIKQLHRQFLMAIPAADHAAWQRGRFTAELGAEGIEVALIDRRYYAVGLSLVDSPAAAK
jgi:hypothetical protein